MHTHIYHGSARIWDMQIIYGAKRNFLLHFEPRVRTFFQEFLNEIIICTKYIVNGPTNGKNIFIEIYGKTEMLLPKSSCAAWDNQSHKILWSERKTIKNSDIIEIHLDCRRVQITKRSYMFVLDHFFRFYFCCVCSRGLKVSDIWDAYSALVPASSKLFKWHHSTNLVSIHTH